MKASAYAQQVRSFFIARRRLVLAPSAHISAHLAAARTAGCRATRTSARSGLTSLLIPVSSPASYTLPGYRRDSSRVQGTATLHVCALIPGQRRQCRVMAQF